MTVLLWRTRDTVYGVLTHAFNSVLSITALPFPTIHSLPDLSGSQLAVRLRKLLLVFPMIAGCVMATCVVIKSM